MINNPVTKGACWETLVESYNVISALKRYGNQNIQICMYEIDTFNDSEWKVQEFEFCCIESAAKIHI